MFEKENKKIKANIFMKTFSSEKLFLSFHSSLLRFYRFSINEIEIMGSTVILRQIDSNDYYENSADSCPQISTCLQRIKMFSRSSILDPSQRWIGKRDEKKLFFFSRGGKWI